MDEREENLRDSRKDEAAFDHVPLRVVHDHMNPDGTEQTPSRALLNAVPDSEIA